MNNNGANGMKAGDVVRDKLTGRIGRAIEFLQDGDAEVKFGSEHEMVKWHHLERVTQDRPKKPILCVDFDGVLHSYKSGWQGAMVIPDPPVPGALEFLAEALKHFHVCIYSSRSNQPGGIAAMQTWISSWAIKVGVDLNVIDQLWFPTEKPAAKVSIDDRGWQFTGVWPTITELLEFRPWNMKKEVIGQVPTVFSHGPPNRHITKWQMGYDAKGNCVYFTSEANRPARAIEMAGGVVWRYTEDTGEFVGVTLTNPPTNHPASMATDHGPQASKFDQDSDSIADLINGTPMPTEEQIKVGVLAIDDFYDGAKDADIEGSVANVYRAMRALADDHGPPAIELCFCELSGEAHVIENGQACELCRAENRVPFTPENVTRYFKGYEGRLAKDYVPKINAKFETISESCGDIPGLIGQTEAKIKRIEREDDGSVTVVLDHWPNASAS